MMVERHNGIEPDPDGVYVTFEDYKRLRVAAEFGLAVLWGSDGDKKGAIKYLEKALGRENG